MVTEWSELIGDLKEQEPYQRAVKFYNDQVMQGKHCFPSHDELFNAFKFTKLSDLKVIIIGQDPYHEQGQAMGLSFSVKPGIKVPPSLVNIYKELAKEFPDFVIPKHGCLVDWAKQGVLLLNSILSVEEGKPLSHQNCGWQEFTDSVIERINQASEHNVYILWGAKARDKCRKVDRSRNLILECPHPSPLSASRGFFGCNHFALANQYLVEHGKSPINWQLPEVAVY